ncbi:MAG TPA: hypothetical protein PLE30_09680 [Candidatus Kapabacteria bacterium]|nr:hypothetical protein [Candidatus Kapabacteria bacterium]
MNNIRIILLLVSIVALNACQELVSPDLQEKSNIVKTETKWSVSLTSNSKLFKSHYIEYDKKSKILLNEEYNTLGLLYSRSLYTHGSNASTENLQVFNEQGNIINQQTIIYDYDAGGRIIKKILYNDKGVIISTSNFAYDFNGNIISKIENNPLSGKLTTDFSYAYNTSGNLIERVTLSEGTTKSRDSLVYSPSNKALTIYSFNSSNTIISYEVFNYNIDGLVIEQLKYNQSNVLTQKFIYEYTFYN